MTTQIDQFLTLDEQKQLTGLDSPRNIQEFLDTTLYNAAYDNRCPLRVLREGIAHCLDGALFGAMALRRLGYSPLVLDMFPEPGSDDDHVLAIYRYKGCYGAVAKSNFAGLRLREPVYRSLRELVMSYFEDFYNIEGKRTLRSYTRPLDLLAFDRYSWEQDDRGCDRIEKRLLKLKRRPLLTPEQASALTQKDMRSYQAGMLGTLAEGLYQPKKEPDDN